MSTFYTTVFFQHSLSIFEIETIIKKEQSVPGLKAYVQKYINYLPEYYDYSWNIDDSELDDNGFLVPDFSLGNGIIEMDCPAVYFYIKQNILQANFDIKWDGYLKQGETINKIVSDLLNKLDSSTAILIPSSQGEDYPSLKLKAAGIPLHLHEINNFMDLEILIEAEGIVAYDESNVSEDCFIRIER